MIKDTVRCEIMLTWCSDAVSVRCVDDKDKATAMALGTCVSNLAGTDIINLYLTTPVGHCCVTTLGKFLSPGASVTKQYLL